MGHRQRQEEEGKGRGRGVVGKVQGCIRQKDTGRKTETDERNRGMGTEEHNRDCARGAEVLGQGQG